MSDDMMETIEGKVHVPGWDHMKSEHSNLARTLQAIANLELQAALHGGLPPRQIAILNEVNRLGGNLSPKSQNLIAKYIKRLEKSGHVIPKAVYLSGEEQRGRGKTSPWRTKVISEFLKRSINGNK